MFGIRLRKGEGLVRVTLSVVVSDIDAAVVTVVAARGEDNPSAIAAPRGVALGTRGIDIGQ